MSESHDASPVPTSNESTPFSSSSSRRRRRWFPLVAVGVGAALIVLAWAWPGKDLERFLRVTATLIACLATGFALVIWALFGSGLRRLHVLAGLAVLGVAAVAMIRDLHFTGDMVPILEFRWHASRYDDLDAYRQRTGTKPVAESDRWNAPEETDFPEYRNRRRDGQVHGIALETEWDAHPPRERWRHPCGGGFSGFAVSHGWLYTQEQRRDKEAIVCYDADTGQERWSHEYPAYFVDRPKMGGEGPRATPTLSDDGLVYALGATGVLCCLDARTGDLKWSCEILKNNSNLKWGMAGSPLIVDDLVVVNPGRQKPSSDSPALVAFHRQTGQFAWGSGTTMAGYSSPQLAILAGKRQILLLDAQQIAGYDPDHDGRLLWKFPWKTHDGINVAQPLVLDGDQVFIASAYLHGSALLQVRRAGDDWSVEALWTQRTSMRCKYNSPVVRDGYLYGLDEGVLECVAVEDGTRRWRDEESGHFGHGQVLLVGDMLFVTSEDGRLALVAASPDQFRMLAEIRILDGKKNWNCPAIARGRAYVRNESNMACFDLPVRVAK